jgi:hypothetical protein
VSNGIQEGIRATEDVVAVPVYFTYYGSYYAAKGINSVGNHFGTPGRVISHVVALPFVPFEALGLGGDIAIDEIKGEDWADESRDQCDKRPINPLHSFDSLPSFLRAGPKIYLPGAYRDSQGSAHVNWEW